MPNRNKFIDMALLLLYAEDSVSKKISKSGNFNLSLILKLAVHDAILIKRFVVRIY